MPRTWLTIIKAKKLIIKANIEYVDLIKKIADANRHELGFTLRIQIQEAVEQDRVLVSLIEGKLVGFLIYRHRKKDTQTTLAEICISKEFRGEGIGRELVNALINESKKMSRSYIQLKCPVGLYANEFYKQLGFHCIATQPGKTRSLNVWRIQIDKAED